MDDRSSQLNRWLEGLGYREFRLSPASEDASFRRYLRLEADGQSLIVMDAPPELEPCDQFVKVAGLLRDVGLSTPELHAQDLEQGFLLLGDFGTLDYLSQLHDETGASLYRDALAALLVMQTRIDGVDLPPYDVALLFREMDLFHDWFLGELLGLELNPEQQEAWLSSRQVLADNALEQPRVFVHRDYHSRNLMKIPRRNPGILDFQDAVHGPLTYDLVSLLRDCYIAWPPARVESLALDFYQAARANGLVEVDSGQFLRWFDLMGAQRHLKAIGIFSRLKIRDGKSGYLKDIPRTLEYLCQVSAAREPLAGLAALIEQLELVRRADEVAAR
ncbi:MAG TPA: phosphotransferase [Gammaproteobacteria bacterium]|nr:phosphotransferase [Gammaproteobacteria bacterium]